MILQRTMTEAGTVGYAPTVSESYALGTVFEKERRRVRQWAISAMAGGLAGTWMARRRGLMVGWARGVLGSTFLAVSCGYVIAMSSVKEVARVACALDTPTGAEARHWSQVAKTGLTFSVAPYHRELFESIPRLASAAKLEQEAEEARLIREAEATGDATRLRWAGGVAHFHRSPCTCSRFMPRAEQSSPSPAMCKQQEQSATVGT